MRRDGIRKGKAHLEFGISHRICRTIGRASTRTSVRKGRIKKIYPPTHSQINKSGNLVATSMEKAGGFSLTISLPTSLRSLSLKAGTGQTKSLPFRRRLGLRPPEEPEPTHIHGKWTNVSQGPEGVGRCNCQNTLHDIWKVVAVKALSDWRKKVHFYVHF